MDRSEPVIVTVKDEYIDRIEQVTTDLRVRGLTVNQVMPITGVITGTCAPESISALEQVEGALRVDKERYAELPPTESSPQ